MVVHQFMPSVFRCEILLGKEWILPLLEPQGLALRPVQICEWKVVGVFQFNFCWLIKFSIQSLDGLLPWGNHTGSLSVKIIFLLINQVFNPKYNLIFVSQFALNRIWTCLVSFVVLSFIVRISGFITFVALSFIVSVSWEWFRINCYRLLFVHDCILFT